MSTKNLRNPALIVPEKMIQVEGKTVVIPERRIKYLDDRVLPCEIDSIARHANLDEDQKLRLQIASDPALWASVYLVNPEDHSKELDLRFYQKDMLQTPSRFKILRFGRQTGKCVVGNTLIAMADGSYETAETLYNKYGKHEIKSFEVVSYDENGKLITQPALITFNGIEECIKFELKKGQIITVTENHKMKCCDDEYVKTYDKLAKDVTCDDYFIGVGNLYKFTGGVNSEANQEDKYIGLTERDFTLLGIMIQSDIQEYDTIFEINHTRMNPQITEFFDEYVQQTTGTKLYSETKKHSTKFRIAYTAGPNNILNFLDKYDMIPYIGDQYLPSIFYTLPYKFTLAFIRGICLGGSQIAFLSNNTVHLRLNTKYQEITESVCYMLGRFGLTARRRLRWTEKAEDEIVSSAQQVTITDPTHIATILNYGKIAPDEEIEKVKCEICTSLGKERAEYDNIIPSRSKIFESSRVLNMSKTKPQKTYNIEVAETHTYIANGVVTNNSVVLSTDILWRALNNPQYKILVVTPMLEQVKTIFNRIRSLMGGKSPVNKMVVRDKDNPPYLEFSNGSSIKGFVAGDGPRGQSANALYYDESDYISDDIKESIHPVVFNFPDHVIVEASTPTGKRSEFYRKCVDDNEYVEFYWPSHSSPSWTPETDAIYKATHSAAAYVHEVLAEFGSPESGVFRGTDIDIALQQSHIITETDLTGKAYTRSYNSGEIKQMLVDKFAGKKDKPKILFGVDWNGAEHGVQIVIIGCADKLYVMDVVTIGGSEFTQTMAVERLVALNDIYDPEWIYVDTGYGGMQIETLHLHGKRNPTTRLDKKVVGIDFGSVIEIPDKATGEVTKKLMKPLMMDRFQRLLEEHRIVMPDVENKQNGLAEQMRNFEIDRYGSDGTPIYSHSSPDHKIMAATLALFAYSQKIELIDAFSYVPGLGVVSKNLTERLHLESIKTGSFIRRKLDELNAGPNSDYMPQKTIASVAGLNIPYGGILPRDGRVTDPLPQAKRKRDSFDGGEFGRAAGRSKIMGKQGRGSF